MWSGVRGCLLEMRLLECPVHILKPISRMVNCLENKHSLFPIMMESYFGAQFRLITENYCNEVQALFSCKLIPNDSGH